MCLPSILSCLFSCNARDICTIVCVIWFESSPRYQICGSCKTVSFRVLADIMTESSFCFRKGDRMQMVVHFFGTILVQREHIIICFLYSECLALVMSVGSGGGWTLAFAVKVMVWYSFVIDSQKNCAHLSFCVLCFFS